MTTVEHQLWYSSGMI